MSEPLPVHATDVQDAQHAIAGQVRRTPLLPSAWLSRRAGAEVALKLESLQITSSFKARGALNALLRLRDADGNCRDVVTASAGNHGRAIAWAAERVGLRATIFTPTSAPRSKTAAIKAHGAVLRDEADSYEHAERLAQAYAAETHAVFVSPYDHPDVITGAGTVALELVEDAPSLDTILVPVGGGGLISGIAVAAKASNPGIRIIGVEAAASRAFHAARSAGRIVTIDVQPTIADGLGGNVDPRTITWPIIRTLVDDVVVVSEAALRRSIVALLAEEHLVAEGAGAAAVAAVLEGLLPAGANHVAVVMTGANIDSDRLCELVQSA